MSANQKNKIIYRCPVCFGREIDITLNKDKDGIYRCVKCSFYGTESDITKMYDFLRMKYHLLGTRITLEQQRKM